jgi:DNA polymerase I-like protein with 3'-5' exonuclease and polymerase domains
LRLTSNSPNEQNISKKEEFNLRYAFGPAKGREWWSLDCKNIELRIPAYVAGETAMIELFERPDDPPYYGSNHLLFFDILHPEKFAKYGKEVKKVYASTWYQWTKNGDFAVQYNAQEGSGTADRAYHVEGAHRMINERLTNIKKLSDIQIEIAEERGYVETLPDRSVDSEHGYPLLCTRTKWGGIKSTIPLSYFVQGSAMWVMFRMMVKVQAILDRLNRGISKVVKDGYFIAAQIHDEIVLDFPYVED